MLGMVIKQHIILYIITTGNKKKKKKLLRAYEFGGNNYVDDLNKVANPLEQARSTTIILHHGQNPAAMNIQE